MLVDSSPCTEKVNVKEMEGRKQKIPAVCESIKERHKCAVDELVVMLIFADVSSKDAVVCFLFASFGARVDINFLNCRS